MLGAMLYSVMTLILVREFKEETRSFQERSATSMQNRNEEFA